MSKTENREPNLDIDDLDDGIEAPQRKRSYLPLIGVILIAIALITFGVRTYFKKKSAPVVDAQMIAAATTNMGQASSPKDQPGAPALPPGMLAKIREASASASASSSASGSASASASASAASKADGKDVRQDEAKRHDPSQPKEQKAHQDSQGSSPKKVAFGGMQSFDENKRDSATPEKPKTTRELLEERVRAALAPPAPERQALPYVVNGANAPQSTTTQIGGNPDDRAFPVASMQKIGNPTLTIEAGRDFDCVLTRQLVLSGLAQPAQCKVVRDVTGFDGRAVVIEAGSTVNGSASGGAGDGQERFSANWTSIITPSGYRVAIKSGTMDATGAAGVPGDVNNRWPERLFGAFAVSALADFISYKTSQNKSGSTLALAGNTTGAIQKTGEKVFDKTTNRQPIAFIKGGTVVRIEMTADINIGATHDVNFVGRQ